MHNSTENHVVLSSVQLSSTGVYRCEVSGEAPYFQTVTEHARMVVVGEYSSSLLIILFVTFVYSIQRKLPDVFLYNTGYVVYYVAWVCWVIKVESSFTFIHLAKIKIFSMISNGLSLCLSHRLIEGVGVARGGGVVNNGRSLHLFRTIRCCKYRFHIELLIRILLNRPLSSRILKDRSFPK